MALLPKHYPYSNPASFQKRPGKGDVLLAICGKYFDAQQLTQDAEALTCKVCLDELAHRAERALVLAAAAARKT